MRQRQADPCESEVSLVYTLSSGTDMPHSETQTQNEAERKIRSHYLVLQYSKDLLLPIVILKCSKEDKHSRILTTRSSMYILNSAKRAFCQL